MKKLLALCLAVLFVFSMTACTQQETTTTAAKEETTPAATQAPQEAAVLKVSGLLGGYKEKGWEAVAKAFEEKENVKVELRLQENIAETLRSEVQAGVVPDVIYLAVGSKGGFTDTMIAEKLLLDISDVLSMNVYGENVTVSEKLLAGFSDGLTTKPYGDGKLYLAPINYSPTGLFYNAGLFEEKGWQVPKTFDEMWELGEKAKAEGIALFTYPTVGYFDGFFSALLNETAGPQVYDKLMRYDAEAWKMPEVKKAFEIVGKLAQYTEKTTVANANGENYKKNQQLILDNKALFVPNGTWLPGEMADAPRADGFRWGFTALPKVDASGDAYATTFLEQVYVPSDAAQPELAKKFVSFLYSDEAVKLFYENGGAVIPVKGVASIMEAGSENQLFYSIYETGAKANNVGFIAVENAVEGVNVSNPDSGVLYSTVNSIVNGSKTVEEWYQATVDAVQKISEANK